MTFLLLFFSLVAGAHEDEFDAQDRLMTPGEFRLIDQNGVSQSLSYYNNYRLVLLVGYATCAGNSELPSDFEAEIAKREKSRDLKLLYINPKPETRESVVKAAGARRPILMDDTQSISRSFGLRTSGDFVLIDMKSLREISRGSLKNPACLKSIFTSQPQCDLTSAQGWIENLMAKFSPSRCSLDVKDPVTYTYTKEVSPVLAKHCVSCHSNEDFGDFTSFEKAAGWSAMIRHVLRTGFMPPGGRDFYQGHFTTDMDSESRRILLEWTETGATRGPGEDRLATLAKSGKFAPRESFHKAPDLVFKQKKKHIIPATGYLEYQYEKIAGPISEDIYFWGLDIKLNGRVAHHANLFISKVPITSALLKEKGDGSHVIPKHKSRKKKSDQHGDFSLVDESILMTAAKGSTRGTFLRKGLAYLIPKGSYLAIEYHYTPSGRVEENQAIVELFTYKNAKRENLRPIRRMTLRRDRFEIPPHEANFTIQLSAKIENDITVLGFKPHMHYRGRSVKIEAVYPDGRAQILLSVPYYQMKSQPSHVLKDGIFLPAGTVLRTEHIYDNSAQNPQNPDPTQTVPSGSQTYSDEMHLPRVYYVDGQFEGGMMRPKNRRHVGFEEDL